MNLITALYSRIHSAVELVHCGAIVDALRTTDK